MEHVPSLRLWHIEDYGTRSVIGAPTTGLRSPNHVPSSCSSSRRDPRVWHRNWPTTSRWGHAGCKRFDRLRGIGSERDGGRWPLRVSPPQRDLPEVLRGLHDAHRARMTQDRRGAVLRAQRGTARGRAPHLLVEQGGAAHPCPGPAVGAQEPFRHGAVPPHGPPRPESIGCRGPQGERTFPSSLPWDLPVGVGGKVKAVRGNVRSAETRSPAAQQRWIMARSRRP